MRAHPHAHLGPARSGIRLRYASRPPTARVYALGSQQRSLAPRWSCGRPPLPRWLGARLRCRRRRSTAASRSS